MYDTEKMIEKLIVVGVENDSGQMDIEMCLDELEELARTAGAEVVGRITQKRDKIHAKHYLGKGKIEELKEFIGHLGATGVLCDDELSPSQLRNMAEMLDTKVMDRTMIILDIFAERASSAEGKVQVELAQLKYRLSHLSGIGTALSRLGGGIGTRGPGEKKLETDRRHIKNRLAELNNDLKEIESHRIVLREKREKRNIPVVSMVGYTNAGKSSILNYLTNANVLAENKLFATLDTTTKKLALPGGIEILYTDTVGFIQKLPHSLIKAFKATLEELNYADILIHVVDISNTSRQEQIDVVYKTLSDLKLLEKPIITVFNKMDNEPERPFPSDSYARKIVCTSAKTGEGIDEFLAVIEEVLNSFREKMTILIPFVQGSLLSYVHGNCEILSESHTEEGTMITGYFTEEGRNRFEHFKII